MRTLHKLLQSSRVNSTSWGPAVLTQDGPDYGATCSLYGCRHKERTVGAKEMQAIFKYFGETHMQRRHVHAGRLDHQRGQRRGRGRRCLTRLLVPLKRVMWQRRRRRRLRWRALCGHAEPRTCEERFQTKGLAISAPQTWTSYLRDENTTAGGLASTCHSLCKFCCVSIKQPQGGLTYPHPQSWDMLNCCLPGKCRSCKVTTQPQKTSIIATSPHG